MATLLQVISDAMTDIGELGQGQSANAEEAARGLRAANRLLQSAQTDRLMQHYVNNRELQLTYGTNTYTYGTGGDFNYTRPVFVESAQVELRNEPGSGRLSMPLNMIDKAKWDAIRDKTALANMPTDIYIEYAASLLTLRLHPRPGGFIVMPYLMLGVWERLQLFTAVETEIALPEEYERWLEWAIAVEMAPGFQKGSHPDMQIWMRNRDEARAAVMSKNAQSMGGAVGESRTLDSPNLGKPIPQG